VFVADFFERRVGYDVFGVSGIDCVAVTYDQFFV
jgi:hypothetical protein